MGWLRASESFESRVMREVAGRTGPAVLSDIRGQALVQAFCGAAIRRRPRFRPEQHPSNSRRGLLAVVVGVGELEVEACVHHAVPGRGRGVRGVAFNRGFSVSNHWPPLSRR